MELPLAFMEMEDFLFDANQELKRVDHLVFVSLKYTRTVDVIRSVVLRLIEALDRIVHALLEYEKQQKKIQTYPENPGQRLEFLKTLYAENIEIQEYLKFHSLLRKMTRMPFTKREEYRRHVTMTVMMDTNEQVDVHIDQLREYYNKAKDFFAVAKQIIKKEHD